VDAKTKKKRREWMVLRCRDFEIYHVSVRSENKKIPVSDITDEELVNTRIFFHLLLVYISIAIKQVEQVFFIKTGSLNKQGCFIKYKLTFMPYDA
jgi:hypothetical protein